MPNRILSLFRNLFRRRSAERALEEELLSSVEMLTDEKVTRDGLSPSEAHRQALIELGGLEQVKEAVRAERYGRWLEDFAGDLRFAVRTTVRSPGLAVAAITSIALGIAANSTVFSVASGLLWGVLPVKEPGRLLMFSEGRSFSYPDYLDYRDQTRDVFEGVAAHFPLIPASLGGGGEPERVWGQVVSDNYFSVLGVRMALGRPILPGEDRATGRDRVVVLGHSLWQRRFGADGSVLGQDVLLSGQRCAVVGVAPAGFHGSVRGIASEFWVPLSMTNVLMPDLTWPGDATARRDKQWLLLNARLRPGVTSARATVAVNLVKKRLDDSYRRDQARHDAVSLQPAGGLIAGSVTPAYTLMALLMIVVALVLLVACANVANLLLARAIGRRREIGIRLALGAGRGRLVRQLLTESLLLSLAGAAVGLLLAALAARAISSFRLPAPIPVAFDFNVDGRAAAFTAGLSLVTALLFGLVPALRATRPDLVRALKEGTAVPVRAGRLGVRNTLVVVQVALSLVLLTVAGLFLRSLGSASSIDVGFRPENILVMRVDPRIHNYSPEKSLQFLSRLRERVSALPGVRSVSFVDTLPLSLAGTGLTLDVDATKDQPARTAQADVRGVFSGYFQTMGIPLLSGRDFDPHASNREAAILSQATCRRLFPGQDPIGRRIHAGRATYTVIGVARDSKSRTVGEAPVNGAYLYLDLGPETGVKFFGVSALVRTLGDPRALEGRVRGEIAALDPDMAVFGTETMQEHLGVSLLLPRLSACVLGIFGAVGLTLGAIGLYGVVSYSVRRRTREISIRMALGARPGSVLATVLRQGLTVTGVGIAIGLALAAALGRLAGSLLYGVSGTDLTTFLAVPAVLAGTASLAIWVPARRAARVDPAIALRED